MVSTKEIRVGNWFEHNGTWSYKSLDNAPSPPFIFQWTDYDWYALVECTLYLEDVSPIPLTPEILQACGCTQGNDKSMWRNPLGVWLTQIANSERFYVSGFRAGHSIGYLHEFQNTTFALTGEELVYKPIKELIS